MQNGNCIFVACNQNMSCKIVVKFFHPRQGNMGNLVMVKTQIF